jgi:hypothetical protein
MLTMMNDKPIASVTLDLELASASHVIGLADEYIVFPAINFDKKAKPPQENLNRDAEGPRIVQVTVQQIRKDDARRGHFGHVGVERLTLLLPRDSIERWVEQLKLIRSAGPLRVGAAVDEHGDIGRLMLNDEPVDFPISSGTRQGPEAAAESTGTD